MEKIVPQNDQKISAVKKYGPAGCPKIGLKCTPEYKAWLCMKSRCYNPNDPSFRSYGGRGLYVCERWIYSFKNFFADLGPRPSAKHSLNRLNNNGIYEPGNVAWSTQIEQARNKRSNHLVEHCGKMKPISQIAEDTGVHRFTIYNRLRIGWSLEDALRKLVRPQSKLKR